MTGVWHQDTRKMRSRVSHLDRYMVLWTGLHTLSAVSLWITLALSTPHGAWNPIPRHPFAGGFVFCFLIVIPLLYLYLVVLFLYRSLFWEIMVKVKMIITEENFNRLCHYLISAILAITAAYIAPYLNNQLWLMVTAIMCVAHLHTDYGLFDLVVGLLMGSVGAYYVGPMKILDWVLNRENQDPNISDTEALGN